MQRSTHRYLEDERASGIERTMFGSVDRSQQGLRPLRRGGKGADDHGRLRREDRRRRLRLSQRCHALPPPNLPGT